MVRLARPGDWPAMQVAFATAGKAAWTHLFDEEFLGRLAPPDRWRLAIEDSAQAVFVAEVEGSVAGFAIVHHSSDEDAGPETGELDSFYVHAGYWGQGVGRELLRAAVRRLAEMGFTTATLWTAELNHRPRRVYERAGWELDGARRERSLGGRSFIELRYRRDLPDDS
ncbi:MAG TPA: GNAT family N-acetyltransferase [Fimbriimonadaceae bacterium]|nr:GNAT family N-acetyltransferase [Fimbriimonadaceae bacterium]